MTLWPSLSLICLPMTKVFESYTRCVISTATKTCERPGSVHLFVGCLWGLCVCVSLCVWNPLPSVNTMCAYTNWASIQKCLFLCTFLCCVCVCNVCACLSVANYPSYKYKIPIRHWVSGWLQRRHNWFQMVTQIFLSRLQHHHTGCVWEKATGESEVESGKKEEWQEWINTERAQE